MKHVDNYKTKDQFLASVLYALGERFLFSEWQDGKCYLYFSDKTKSEEIIAKYYSGN